MRVVLTSVDSEAAAGALARALVEERLAACVNIIAGVRSIYRWQDTIEDGAEWLLVIKTAAPSLEALHERLHQLHPYDLPEWLVLEPSQVSDAYGAWVARSSCSEDGSEHR